MDRQGRWRLSPAFDLVFSYNPDGDWTARHQMTLNGRQDHFTFDDFRALAHFAGLKRGRERVIIDEVRQCLLNWSDYARRALRVEILQLN
jgi:serine/threonine-protein kinase HipA